MVRGLLQYAEVYIHGHGVGHGVRTVELTRGVGKKNSSVRLLSMVLVVPNVEFSSAFSGVRLSHVRPARVE